MKTTPLNFKEKVQAMTAKEIIMAMVDGLQNPVVNVDMWDFGRVTEGGICFGCAATNAVCKIAGKVFDSSNILETGKRADFLETDADFLALFESLIDSLRQGDVEEYNIFAPSIGVAQIKDIDYYLPYLYNEYTHQDLQAYIDLANAQ